MGIGCVLELFMLLAAAISYGCSAGAPPHDKGSVASAFRMESPAFGEGDEIPQRFTCEGKDISPGLRWRQAPQGTRSFVLIAEDPDAPGGTWIHWVVYDLPARTEALSENVPKAERVPGGGVQGRNSFGRIGYGGPCPPPGKAHRYYFKLYALDTLLHLRAGAEKAKVLAAAQGHVLGEAQIMGRFKRQ